MSHISSTHRPSTFSPQPASMAPASADGCTRASTLLSGRIRNDRSTPRPISTMLPTNGGSHIAGRIDQPSARDRRNDRRERRSGIHHAAGRAEFIRWPNSLPIASRGRAAYPAPRCRDWRMKRRNKGHGKGNNRASFRLRVNNVLAFGRRTIRSLLSYAPPRPKSRHHRRSGTGTPPPPRVHTPSASAPAPRTPMSASAGLTAADGSW